MVRINGLKLPVTHTEEELIRSIAKKARGQKPVSYEIVRRSIDARKRPSLFYVYTLDVCFETEKKLTSAKNSCWTAVKKDKYVFPGETLRKRPAEGQRPVIIGAGPAGLFAGLVLARTGYCPVILERGDCVERRTQKVDVFWDGGSLDPESNVQFGEGGAGTFSDGKLNTLVKDRYKRNSFVLEEFVKHGAPEDILYDAKPHIGTDILKEVVVSIRNEIISLGGTVIFRAKMTEILTDYTKQHVTGVRYVKDGVTEERACSQIILAIGHSARDTFSMLSEMGISMSPKSFAIGVRVEHEAQMINRSMYGEEAPSVLGAASYKLTHQCKNGRGVYTFCMCPGGFVVNSSSEDGFLCVNGMSYRARDSVNSNSAVIVTVTPEDFPGNDSLAGMRFQRIYEKLAYEAAGGKIPVQRFADFMRNIKSGEPGTIRPQMKGSYEPSNVRAILPSYVAESIEEGILAFGKKVQGYDQPDTLISGVETRTSSPLRIERDESACSSLAGLYPCGEGAGYAGGITSAAMDGIKVAECLAAKTAGL